MEDEVAEEAKTEKSPSFFGRLFRRKPSADPALSEEPAPVSGQSGTAVSPTPAAPSSVYRLKVGDAIFITLSGSLGVNEQIETQVDERGFVKLRYIGSVRAEGRSATELEREIEAEYTDRQNIYKEIYARVVLPNTFYFIGGEVRSPGRFPLVGSVSLSQAVVSAGGAHPGPRGSVYFRCPHVQGR
jgi:polysaccharide export outer membrane protein